MRVSLILIFLGFQITCFSQLKLNSQNRLSLNYDGTGIGSSSFIVSQEANGYGGMYLNIESSGDARPFYGYAENNSARAWHYYHNSDNTWNLNLASFDRLKIGVDSSFFLNELVASNSLKVNKDLIVGSPSKPDFEVSSSDGMLYNASKQLNTFSDFTLNSTKTDLFGGMYVNVDNGATGRPFYGYAINSVDKAYSYYDAETSSWELFVNGGQPENVLSVKNSNFTVNGSTTTNGNATFNGIATMNTNQAFNDFTDLTIDSKTTSFGGIFINVDSDANNDAKPFYGYAVDGLDRAFSFYDQESATWKLYVAPNLDHFVLEAENRKLIVDGSLQLKNLNASGQALGTIFYFNGHFYGRTSSGTRQLDNIPPMASKPVDSENDQAIQRLEEENQELKSQLSDLASQVAALAQKMNK